MLQNLYLITLLVFGLSNVANAQSYVSNVWVADQGNGTYKNPVLHADYSDPDVCAVGEDFYMTASSFNCVPGLPILHSKDLVNWEIVNHALNELTPTDVFNKVQHGNGVYAPCIRFHKGEFYIYWGDPDRGIYMVKTKNPYGEWEEPVLVKEGKGMIDPSPLWDDDGKVYLVHAWALSRSNINTILTVNEMNAEGTAVIGNPVLVFDGNDGLNYTVEGPKFYKRNGYYYIFAPSASVAYGWQLTLRSKNIYGPYEHKVVMQQGNTEINGPHQGGYVETVTGESWFMHFQDKGVYGRVVHLNPIKWVNDWPVIGVDRDGDGCGEPVISYRKPDVGKEYPVVTPVESDEFNSHRLGRQWQWHANYNDTYGFPTSMGFMRLYSCPLIGGAANLWNVPSMLLQKFPAEKFTVDTKLSFYAKQDGEQCGLIVMGWDYGYLSVVKHGTNFKLRLAICKNASRNTPEEIVELAEVPMDEFIQKAPYSYIKRDLYLRVKVEKGGICTFYYSLDNKKFVKAEKQFKARQGTWIGAKMGLFSTTPQSNVPKGWMDVDYFRVK